MRKIKSLKDEIPYAKLYNQLKKFQKFHKVIPTGDLNIKDSSPLPPVKGGGTIEYLMFKIKY